MHIIGTAGHVDHGKSTLIAALTGTHPDRLKEEKDREMTIELGFASLRLPNGEEIGIIMCPVTVILSATCWLASAGLMPPCS